MRINSFVTPDALKADTVVLSAEESHHLARVLRVEAGQELTLFDGEGTRAEAVITRVDKKGVEVEITARETTAPPAVEITLVQAVCKPDRFEMILQKATELGVRTIQPIITQNASLPTGKIDKMISRGEAISRPSRAMPTASGASARTWTTTAGPQPWSGRAGRPNVAQILLRLPAACIQLVAWM